MLVLDKTSPFVTDRSRLLCVTSSLVHDPLQLFCVNGIEQDMHINHQTPHTHPLPVSILADSFVTESVASETIN